MLTNLIGNIRINILNAVKNKAKCVDNLSCFFFTKHILQMYCLVHFTRSSLCLTTSLFLNITNTFQNTSNTDINSLVCNIIKFDELLINFNNGLKKIMKKIKRDNLTEPYSYFPTLARRLMQI